MTSQISKDVKTHIILTYSGNKVFITSQQEKALRQLGDSDRLYIEDRMVRVNTIKEVLPLNEYYNEHPDERPQYNNYTYNDAKQLPQGDYSYEPSRHVRALKSMRRGFIKHWNGREMNDKARTMLETMNKRIKEAEGGKVHEMNPTKLFGY